MSADNVPPSPRRWFVGDVLVPFVASRLALLIVASYARNIPPYSRYTGHRSHHRSFVSHRLLDIWGRWDTEWYLRIIQDGYQARGYPHQADIAFFPLFPQWVRALHRLLPEAWRTRESAYLLAVASANVFALGALALLHRHVRRLTGDVHLAGRTVLYVLAFPTGFFLSCAYTESLFLLLAVATFDLALQRRWALAGATGFLLATTRYSGVTMVAPLAWTYLDDIGWSLRRLRPSVLWLALVPLGLVLYMAYAYRLTGDPLAVVHVQAAWAKKFALPWVTLWRPTWPDPVMTPIDRFLVLGFLACGLVLLVRRASAAGGLFVVLSLLPILFGGSTMSASRYMLVLFPVFILLARLGARSPLLHQAYLLAAMATQALLMAYWSQWYWVG